MGERVTYPGHGGDGAGYLALPRLRSGPGIAVVRGKWGLVDHIRTVADRFAEAGYAALALDLDPSERAGEPAEATGGPLEPPAGAALDRTAPEVLAAADYLAARPEVTGGVAVVGFGLGGSLALWSAPRSDRIRAAVAFYPLWGGDQPRWEGYAGKAALIHCSEEGVTSTTPAIQAAKKAIEQAGGECTVHDYPGTRRAFFNDDLPEVYDPDAAASAWARTLDLFRTRLG